MEPKLGETKVFSEAICPCCGSEAACATDGADVAFSIERMWNGREWIPLESYEGGWLARRLAGQPVEPIPQS